MRFIIMMFAVLMLYGCGQDKQEELPKEAGNITIIQGDAPYDEISPLIGYNMRGEYQVNFAPDGEEDVTTRMVGAAAVSRSAPYSDIARRLAEKSLGKDYIVKCSPCHDNYANGVIGPSLLDKSADDISSIILKYRSNEEKNSLMQVFVNKMTDEEICDMSMRIHEFNKKMQGRINE